MPELAQALETLFSDDQAWDAAEAAAEEWEQKEREWERRMQDMADYYHENRGHY